MDTPTLARAYANGRLLDPDVPVPLVPLRDLGLPPLRTHARFMAEHDWQSWLRWQRFSLITDDELRRFRRRERDRKRREARQA